MTERRNGRSLEPEDLQLTTGELAVAEVVARYASLGQRPPRGKMEEAASENGRIKWGDYAAIAKSSLRKVLRKLGEGLPLNDQEEEILRQLNTGYDIEQYYRTLAGRSPLRSVVVYVDLWTRNLPAH